jgi:alpha-N-arabinofuranosidase
MPADKTPLMRACMAAGEQFEHRLLTYRELIKARTGRDLPLAITEYNAGIYHYKPPLYRFSLGSALFSADLVRVLVQPETNAVMANYWHFVNDSFGMTSGPQVPDGKPGTWKKMPAYYAYRLWGKHFGTQLVQTQFESPAVEFEGLRNIRPARKALPETDVPLSLRGGSSKGFRWEKTGERSLTANLDGFAGVAYPIITEVKLPQDRLCSLSFEARFIGEAKGEDSFGLSLVDARGWSATRSAIWAQGVEKAGAWRMFRGTFQTQPNCSGATLGWNLTSKPLPSTGRIEIRDLRVTLLKDFGPYKALTGCASLSADGKMLYLIAFNKHHAQDISASIQIAGAGTVTGRYWTVTGPSLEATNLQEELVKETASGTVLEGSHNGAFSHVFPAHSMTAIELIVLPSHLP